MVSDGEGLFSEFLENAVGRGHGLNGSGQEGVFGFNVIHVDFVLVYHPLYNKTDKDVILHGRPDLYSRLVARLTFLALEVCGLVKHVQHVSVSTVGKDLHEPATGRPTVPQQELE